MSLNGELGSQVHHGIRLYYPRRILWACIHCAKCCCDAPNHDRQILLLQSEADEISKATEMMITDFSEPSAHDIYALRMKKKAGKCIFLEGAKCRIYEKRPLVCRFYPMWLTQDNGTYVFGIADECPGIGKGRLFDGDHYVSLLKLAEEKLGTYKTQKLC